MRWGDSKRDHDIILGVWPRANRLTDTWWMQELTEQADGSVKWRDRRVPTPEGHVKVDVYRDRDEAIAQATTLNSRYEQELRQQSRDAATKASLCLKVQKALQSRERLQSEEGLMLAEAKVRHADTPRPALADIDLHPDSEPFRDDLHAQLERMPYLSAVLVGSPRRALFREATGRWSKPYYVGERKAAIVARAEIANGFSFHFEQHWGEVKAAIRQLLLPRANQLLQLASVKRMLADALARGERLLVSGPFVFWYETNGSVGWQIKMTHVQGGEEGGATLWKEGTILSKNHGRLVILPYIKEDGEQVRGHTRNAPKDGPAKPRHPSDFVEIPFQQLSGDLMIGLLGQLPYE